jgi:hypothetical protein
MTSTNQFTKATYKVNDPIVPILDDDQQLELGFDAKTEGLTFRQRRRFQNQAAWKNYWEIRDKESQVLILIS